MRLWYVYLQPLAKASATTNSESSNAIHSKIPSMHAKQRSKYVDNKSHKRINLKPSPISGSQISDTEGNGSKPFVRGERRVLEQMTECFSLISFSRLRGREVVQQPRFSKLFLLWGRASTLLWSGTSLVLLFLKCQQISRRYEYVENLLLRLHWWSLLLEYKTSFEWSGAYSDTCLDREIGFSPIVKQFHFERIENFTSTEYEIMKEKMHRHKYMGHIEWLAKILQDIVILFYCSQNNNLSNPLQMWIPQTI